MVSSKEIRKEMREHPWAGRKTATRIAKDHKRKYHSSKKTTTREGKREYQRNLMRSKLGISELRFGVRGPKPKRFLLRDFVKDLDKTRRQITG